MNPLGIPTPDQWPIISEELAGRRGHFRRQRVGPRDEHLHELRWVPPVIVNAGGMPTCDRPWWCCRSRKACSEIVCWRHGQKVRCSDRRGKRKVKSTAFRISVFVAVVFALSAAWSWERQSAALDSHYNLRAAASREFAQGDADSAVLMAVSGVDQSAPWRASAVACGAVAVSAVGAAVILATDEKRKVRT